MRQEDYLMRLIRQFVAVLMEIRRLRAARQEYAALDTITQITARLLKVPDDGQRRSLEELFAQLSSGARMPLARDEQVALAALLHEAGEIYRAQQRRDESFRSYLRALHLMLDVTLHEPGAGLPEYAPPVETLATALHDYHLPAATYALLLRYYEQTGAYGKAEDALAAWRGAEPESRVVVELGRAFYQRLLQLSDAALEAGNLPRDEVEEGLAGLERLEL